jgi:hypothetical protein
MIKYKLAMLTILSLSMVLFVKLTYANGEYPQTYKVPNFWDEEKGYCFAFQVTNVSCVLASVQMVLTSYDVTPLPTQEELAIEMQTDLNHTTEWNFIHTPFDRRNFTEYINQSLSQDADQALADLKKKCFYEFSSNCGYLV